MEIVITVIGVILFLSFIYWIDGLILDRKTNRQIIKIKDETIEIYQRELDYQKRLLNNKIL